MDENDLRMIRIAVDVAQKARDKGNHPFGAVLADGQGQVLMEAENTVVTEMDCTGHEGKRSAVCTWRIQRQ